MSQLFLIFLQCLEAGCHKCTEAQEAKDAFIINGACRENRIYNALPDVLTRLGCSKIGFTVDICTFLREL